MIKRIAQTAGFTGLLAALLLTVLQSLWVTPLILEAETFEKPAETPAAKPADKPAATPAEKPVEQPAPKAPEKPAAKPADKPAANPPYWYFNSDLRILSPLNHKNIEPLLIGIQTLITKFLTFPGEIFVPIIILPPDFFPPIVPNQITNPQKPIAYLE